MPTQLQCLRENLLNNKTTRNQNILLINIWKQHPLYQLDQPWGFWSRNVNQAVECFVTNIVFCTKLPWTHSHYWTIQSHTKWCFIWHTCINMTFGLSFHVKTFRMTTSLHFVQCGGWICTVSVKTGHCALCSCHLNERQVVSMHSASGAFAKPRPVIWKWYWDDSHIGEKNSISYKLTSLLKSLWNYGIWMYLILHSTNLQ